MASLANGIVIEPFNSTQFDATIIYHCDEDLIPDTIIEAVCGSTGVWSPDPAYHMCLNQSLGKQQYKQYLMYVYKSSLDNNVALTVFCSAPVVPINAHISNQSNSIYLEGTKVTFQCVNGSQSLLTTTCLANGDWNPPLSKLDCNPSGRHIPIAYSE